MALTVTVSRQSFPNVTVFNVCIINICVIRLSASLCHHFLTSGWSRTISLFLSAWWYSVIPVWWICIIHKSPSSNYAYLHVLFLWTLYQVICLEIGSKCQARKWTLHPKAARNNGQYFQNTNVKQNRWRRFNHESVVW